MVTPLCSPAERGADQNEEQDEEQDEAEVDNDMNGLQFEGPQIVGCADSEHQLSFV